MAAGGTVLPVSNRAWSAAAAPNSDWLPLAYSCREAGCAPLVAEVAVAAAGRERVDDASNEREERTPCTHTPIHIQTDTDTDTDTDTQADT